MQASDHCAPLRSRAGKSTRRRSSLGRSLDLAFDAPMDRRRTAPLVGKF